MNGHDSRFTTDKMLDFLKRLGLAVSIRIRPVIPNKLPVQGFEALLFAVATELANAIVGFAEGGYSSVGRASRSQ